MITYKIGSLLDATETVLVHGCNCFHTMGAGVALALKKKWPAILAADQAFSPQGNPTKLGKFSFTVVAGHIICNAYTQYKPGPDLRYNALRSALEAVRDAYPNESIAMPRIGCGLAGGSWDEVEIILNEVFSNREIVIYDL